MESTLHDKKKGEGEREKACTFFSDLKKKRAGPKFSPFSLNFFNFFNMYSSSKTNLEAKIVILGSQGNA